MYLENKLNENITYLILFLLFCGKQLKVFNNKKTCDMSNLVLMFICVAKQSILQKLFYIMILIIPNIVTK